MIKLFNKEISDIYFGSKPVSAVYSGSRLVWMRSSGSEEVVYRFLDAIQFDFRNSFVGNALENYYRTADTTIANGITFPVYAREDGAVLLKVEYSNNHYYVRRYESDGVTLFNGGYPSWNTDENSNIIPFTDPATMEQEEWYTAGETDTISTRAIPAKAYEVTIISADSSASDYVGTKTFTLTNYYSHPSDDNLSIYKSDDGVYMFIADGGDTGSYYSHYSGKLVFAKSISSYYRPNIYSENDWVYETNLDPNYKGGLYLMQDWINEYAFIGVDSGGESLLGNISVTLQSVLPAASAGLTNVTLAGFPANNGFNGTYVNTGTTKTVSWYDYSAQQSASKSFPVFYNGSKYLFVTTNPFDSMSITWAVGSSPSGGNYYCSSTNNDGNLAVNMASETNGSWTDPSDYSSFTVTATNTTSDTPTNDAPVITTFTLTVNYSGTAPSGAKWIVNSVEHEFGSSIDLEAGTYTITYKAVSGYTTPSSQSVTGTAGGSETVTANAYVAETPSITSPDAFVVAGHSTDNYNGTYVKQSTTTTYNGTPYPVYYNGVYYLWHDSSSNTALLGTSSNISDMSSGMPCYYVGGGYKSNVNNFTASDLTGSWSQGMMGTSIALTFTESSSTTPSAGSGEGTAPSSGTPYLYLTNSSTTTYNGYYALVSGTPSASGSKWKHVAKNYWIGYYMSGSSGGPRGWHVYSSLNSVGTENVAQRNVGSSSSNIASTLFAGGATCNGYTITYEDNGYS